MTSRWGLLLSVVWVIIAGIPGVAAAETISFDGIGMPLPAGFKHNNGLEQGNLKLAIERGQTKSYRLITMVRVRIEQPLDIGRFQEKLEGRFPDTWNRRGTVKSLRVDGIGARDSRFFFTSDELEWRQDFIYFPISDGVIYLQLVCPKTAYNAGRDVFNQIIAGVRVDANLRPPTPLIRLETLLGNSTNFVGTRVMITGQFERRARTLLSAGGRAIELVPPGDPQYKALFDAITNGESIWVEGVVDVRPEGLRFSVERAAQGTIEPVTVERLSRNLQDFSGGRVLIDGTVGKEQLKTFLVGPGNRRVSVDFTNIKGARPGEAFKIGKRAVLIGGVSKEGPEAPIQVSKIFQGD